MTLRNGIVERREVDGQQWDLIELPNGDRIIYVEVPENEAHPSHHSYWLAKEEWKRGARLTGGSTLSGPFNFKPDKLLSWKERMTCEGVASLWLENYPDNGKLGTDWLHSGDSIRAKLKEASLLADDARDRKATI